MTARRSCCCTRPTSPATTTSPPSAKPQLEKAGFKVDLQSMDWQTLVGRRAKKDPLDAGGWSAFFTSWALARRARSRWRPPSSTPRATRRRSAGRAIPSSRSCATPIAKETDPAKQKAIAEQVQLRVAASIRRTRRSASSPRRRRSAATSTACSPRRRWRCGTSRRSDGVPRPAADHRDASPGRSRRCTTAISARCCSRPMPASSASGSPT